MKQLGLYSVLSDKALGQTLFVIDKLDATSGKTAALAKKLSEFRAKLPAMGKKPLLVKNPAQKNLFQASRNLPWVSINVGNNLNILDIISADSVVILKDALELIEQTYGKK